MLTLTLCAIATVTYTAAAARTRVFGMPSSGDHKVNLKDGDGLRGVRSSG
jgi:hypothetical protein